VKKDEPGRELPRRIGRDLVIGMEDLVRALERPRDPAAVDGRADLVQTEREAGDDAEVAPAAPERPEEVGVFLPADAANLAVRCDDLDLLEVVDGPAEATRQIAEPAAERQADDAHLGDEAENGRQPVLLSRRIDVLKPRARPDVRDPRPGVDGDLAHAGHVERETMLGDRGYRRCCDPHP
jgi:hypothetical protein